jgi:hypothetical protein
MKPTTTLTSKRLKIDKANATIATTMAISAFVVVFSLVSIKALISQYGYQRRVTSAQQTAISQLQSDQNASADLISSYKTFVGKTTNIIGGSSTGTGPQDGNNATIVLDALPSTYDFPGLVNDLQNLLNNDHVTVTAITGTDNSTTSAGTSSTTPTAAATTPTTSASAPAASTAVAIPFTVSVQGSYPALQTVITSLQNSIRPIKVQTITFSGNDTSLTMNIAATTFYQPSAGLNIGTEAIK